MESRRSDRRRQREPAAEVSGSGSARSEPLTLASRIFGWTNNLLASAIVIAIALTFGLQAIGLWHESRPSDRSVEAETARRSVARAESAIRWNLGAWSGHWTRDEFQGTRDELQARLIDRLTDILSLDRSAIGFSTETTTRLVHSLSQRTLKWRGDSGDEVHLQDGPVPLALAVRSDSSGARRIVAWGVALPGARSDAASISGDDPQPQRSVPLPEPDPQTSGNAVASPDAADSPTGPTRHWVLTLCRPNDDSAERSAADRQLPAECDITFAVDDPSGGRLIGFRSAARIDRLMAAIDSRRHDNGESPLTWNVTAEEAWGSSGDSEPTHVRLLLGQDGIRGLWTE